MLIAGATLWDGSGTGYRADSAVEIADGRIRAVGTRSDFGSRLAADDVLDAGGRYLLPGLVNAHAHLAFMYRPGTPWTLMAGHPADLTIHSVLTAAALLAQGITTARDMGARAGVTLQVRDAIAGGRIPGPRIVACGEPISITGGHGWQTSHEVDGPDAFRAAARLQLKEGADFVKVMASHDPWRMSGPERTRPEVTMDEMRAAFEVAHDWGRPATCHVMGSRAIARALEAGADVIEHGHYLTPALAEAMADAGVFLTPTLSSYDVQTMHPRYERGAEWKAQHETLQPAHQGAMLAAVSAGVRMLVGTDTAGCYAEEVDLLRRAGLSPEASLLACTSNPARALGLENEIGTIEPGKRADLVLLTADSLADPYALEEVELVIKDGRFYRPEELIQDDHSEPGRRVIDLARRPR